MFLFTVNVMKLKGEGSGLEEDSVVWFKVGAGGLRGLGVGSLSNLQSDRDFFCLDREGQMLAPRCSTILLGTSFWGWRLFMVKDSLLFIYTYCSVICGFSVSAGNFWSPYLLSLWSESLLYWILLRSCSLLGLLNLCYFNGSLPTNNQSIP